MTPSSSYVCERYCAHGDSEDRVGLCALIKQRQVCHMSGRSSILSQWDDPVHKEPLDGSHVRGPLEWL